MEHKELRWKCEIVRVIHELRVDIKEKKDKSQSSSTNVFIFKQTVL